MNPWLTGTRLDEPTTPCPAPLASWQPQVDALRQVGRMCHGRGWSLGTSSNYSVVLSRDPVRLLITASGRDKGALGRGDFVVVDQNGQPTFDGQPKSSAETLLHCLLAEDPQTGAVLHTHSVWSTLLSDLYAQQGGFYLEDFEMLKGLEGITTHQDRVWVAIFDNSQDIATLAAEIRQHFQADGFQADGFQADGFQADGHPQIHGFLLRQHGLYTWGHDLFAATRHIEIFEFLFECVGRKLMLQASVASLADATLRSS